MKKIAKMNVRTFALSLFAALALPACGVFLDEENGQRVPLDPTADWSPSSDWAAKGVRDGESNPAGDSYGVADAPADASYESAIPDARPEGIMPDVTPDEDADEEEDLEDEDDGDEEEQEEDAVGDPTPDSEEGGGGGGEFDEPYVLYLSADDSNSQASPIIARWMINSGRIVLWSVVRVYEFLNYYDMLYPPAAGGEVALSTQFRAVDYPGGLYALQVAVSSQQGDSSSRSPMNVTFVLDTSGSMTGTPIELERDVVRAIASRLEEGDIVSAVEWDDTRAIRLDSHVVTGPDDPVILGMASSLDPGGSTNLHAGLVTGYDLAWSNYSAGWLNRVVLISDGQANTGITDVDIIAGAADDSEGEGIYMVGVGVGEGYNDTLMDDVTDAGKGAYIFVDSPDEARRMFVERFLQSMQIAARDVEVELTLPGVFRMAEFFGEEYSTNPAEVDPQHLAPDDAMVFHQLLSAQDPGAVYAGDVIGVRVSWTPFIGGPRQTVSTSDTLQKLIHDDSSQMRKADAVVIYAQVLMKISVLLEEGERDAAHAACLSAASTIQGSAAALDDAELFEIVSLLESYCPVVCPACS